jgi:hypothetical protein
LSLLTIFRSFVQTVVCYGGHQVSDESSQGNANFSNDFPWIQSVVHSCCVWHLKRRPQPYHLFPTAQHYLGAGYAQSCGRSSQSQQSGESKENIVRQWGIAPLICPTLYPNCAPTLAKQETTTDSGMPVVTQDRSHRGKNGEFKTHTRQVYQGFLQSWVSDSVCRAGQ